jgi:DNA-binding NarL/FixJ family response regulator
MNRRNDTMTAPPAESLHRSSFIVHPFGLLLSDDLLDTSRIVGAGRDLGLTIKAARTPDALLALAAQEAPACVLVDLGFPGLSVPDLLRWLGEACPLRPRVVAYGSHVDAAGLRAARQAGCDVVLPRSAFFADLPQQLSGWLNRPAPET